MCPISGLLSHFLLDHGGPQPLSTAPCTRASPLLSAIALARLGPGAKLPLTPAPSLGPHHSRAGSYCLASLRLFPAHPSFQAPISLSSPSDCALALSLAMVITILHSSNLASFLGKVPHFFCLPSQENHSSKRSPSLLRERPGNDLFQTWAEEGLRLREGAPAGGWG